MCALRVDSRYRGLGGGGWGGGASLSRVLARTGDSRCGGHGGGASLSKVLAHTHVCPDHPTTCHILPSSDPLQLPCKMGLSLKATVGLLFPFLSSASAFVLW